MVTISVYTTVEAETLEEAIQKSLSRDIDRFQWSDKDQVNNVWVNDEFDGDVFNIEIE